MGIILFWAGATPTAPTTTVAVRRELPPLELDVELVAPDGHRFLLTGDAQTAEDRPVGLQSTSKRGEGFSTHGFNLRRDTGRDWPDIDLFNAITVTGHEGSVAWEGQLAQQPRSVDDAHSISINAVGWIKHAQDVRMEECYVNRDFAFWGEASVKRKGTNLAAGRIVNEQWWSASDGGIVYQYPSASIDTARRNIELHYQGSDRVKIDTLQIIGTFNGATPGSWSETIVSFKLDDTGSSVRVGTGLYLTQFDGTLRTIAMQDGATRVAFIADTAGVAATPAVGQHRRINQIAAFGSTGVTRRPVTGQPDGVAASDVIKHLVAKYAPLLGTANVTATTYPIAHLIFLDRVTPFDALLAINKFHLFELAVWEDRQLHWGPADLTAYDWQVRADDPQVTVSLQGDSIEDLANGVEIEYDDLATGTKQVLLPANYAELRDDDPSNPVNRAGRTITIERTLSNPSTQRDALQLGRALLFEAIAPKRPGTITVNNYIRDRAGNLQPTWKVRSGDTIAITSSTSITDRPRLIGEASYDHDQRRVTIAVDSTIQRIEAFEDRLGNALQAANVRG